MKYHHDLEKLASTIQAPGLDEFRHLTEALLVLQFEGFGALAARELGEPALEIRKGEVLVLTWSREIFAGVLLADVEADTAADLPPESIANPSVNARPVQAWWDANRARIVEKVRTDKASIKRIA